MDFFTLVSILTVTFIIVLIIKKVKKKRLMTKIKFTRCGNCHSSF